MISSIYITLAAVFLVFLSVRVINYRRLEKVSVGVGSSPALERAMRVQANFTEYTPLLLLLLVVAEMQQLAPVLVHLAGAAIIGARVIHFLGFRSVEAPGLLRVLGMVGTFTMLVSLSVVIVVQLFFLSF